MVAGDDPATLEPITQCLAQHQISVELFVLGQVAGEYKKVEIAMLTLDLRQHGAKRFPCGYAGQNTVRVAVKMGVRHLYDADAHGPSAFAQRNASPGNRRLLRLLIGSHQPFLATTCPASAAAPTAVRSSMDPRLSGSAGERQ